MITLNAMNTKAEKKIYISPRVERIELDNEISLILVSGDPGDPNASLIKPDYFYDDPFKTNLS
jgi:hypothetical protein